MIRPFRYLARPLSKPILVLAVPIMIQGLLMNLMGFVDALMIGQLGEIVISALGNSQQLLSFIFLMMAALSMGGGVLISQAKGAKNTLAMDRHAATMVQIGILAGVVLGFLVWWFAEPLVALLTTDAFKPEVQRSVVPDVAASYLQIVAFGIPFMILNQLLTAAMGATGDTTTPVKIGIAFNVLNFVLNWVLIFGMGLPGLWSPLFEPLGFTGAAIATLIASVGQGTALFFVAKAKDNGINLALARLLSPHIVELTAILKVGYPNTIDGLYWQGARVFYTVLMNSMGAIAYAAYSIVRTFKSLFMLPIGGLQAATAIRIGHLLGARQFNRARATAVAAIIVGVAIMAIPAVLLVVFARPLLQLYAIQPDTEQLALVCMWILAGSLFFTAVNAVIPGLLRAGGDAAAVMHITLLSFLFCGAPLSWLLGGHFKLGLIGAFAGVSLEEAFKAALFIRRMRKGHWVHNLVKPRQLQS